MEEETVVSRARALLKEAKSKGLTDKDLKELLKAKGYYISSKTDKKTDEAIPPENVVYDKSCSLLNTLIFKVYPVVFLCSLFIYPLFKMATGSACLFTDVSPFGEVVNPIVNCDICQGMVEAPRLSNLSKDDFIRNYAYSGRPILVERAASNWSALKVFSYEYFRDLYHSIPTSLDDDDENGQFFSYSSSIRDLKELFSLPSEVASMETDKWYIGWSTANEMVANSLKKHVGVPDFIPPSLSVDNTIAWIFMGSPGPGANLHIDMVDLPSWQAQLRGKKTWRLVPPPECEHVCQEFNVTMNTGDIILVDTNKWYHQTFIHPGSISITIGSEYR